MKHIILFIFLLSLSVVAADSTALSSKTLSEAKFMIDNDAKQLIVITDEETNNVIAKLIERLDKPVPQALIKVLFLEITHNDDFEMGVELGYSQLNRSGTYSAQTLGLGGLTEGGSVGFIDGELDVTLSALAVKHKLEVLSRPSVMTRSNEEAVITIGEEVPFVTNTVISDSGNVTNTVEYEDIGIILTVTPKIDANGLVEMTVEPEISTVTGETVQISDGVEAQTFAKRSASTKVVVPSGKTIVIGGLMDTYVSDKDSKVPLLGDIPVLGRLFKHTVTEKTKKELLIFLTPIVVNNPDDAAELGVKEATNTTNIKGATETEDFKLYVPEYKNEK